MERKNYIIEPKFIMSATTLLEYPARIWLAIFNRFCDQAISLKLCLYLRAMLL